MRTLVLATPAWFGWDLYGTDGMDGVGGMLGAAVLLVLAAGLALTVYGSADRS